MKKNIIVATFALSIAGMTPTLHGMEQREQSNKPVVHPRPWGMARAYEREYKREKIAETRLHKAARENDLCAIKQIASEGNFDINSKDHPLEQTPLHVAVLFGNVEAVKFLLKKCEANPNTVDSRKFYPLHASVSDCSAEGYAITSFLIKYGANLNAPDKKMNTPLHLATALNNTIAVRTLLEKGAKPDEIIIHPFCPTPISTAVHNGNLDIVKIFDELRVKIDINQTSSLGKNLFYHMAFGCNHNPEIDKQNYIKIGEILLEWGCDIDNVDEQGSTPFSTASYYCHFDIMRFIALNLPPNSVTAKRLSEGDISSNRRDLVKRENDFLEFLDWYKKEVNKKK